MHGTIVLNGINDHHLRTILTIKIEHEGALVFNPNQMQPYVPQPVRPGHVPQPTHEQLYNNVVITWTTEAGLRAVKELLHRLTEKLHEAAA
jgi:hypothetical protein